MTCTAPTATDITILTLDAWNAFWADNAECLEDEIGDEPYCRALALRGELMIGGGAAPLYRVRFIGALERAVHQIATRDRSDQIAAFRAMAKKAHRRLLADCLATTHHGAMIKLAWPFYRDFYSSEDAVACLERDYRCERRKAFAAPHRFDGNRLVALHERLVVARYLRRFSRQVWLERRAA